MVQFSQFFCFIKRLSSKKSQHLQFKEKKNRFLLWINYDKNDGKHIYLDTFSRTHTQLYGDNNLRLLKTISDYYTIIFFSLFKYHPQINRFMRTKCRIDKSNTLSNDPNINHCYLQIIIVKCFILYRTTLCYSVWYFHDIRWKWLCCAKVYRENWIEI